MRAYEFLGENASSGATGSGSIASIANPTGSVQRRGFFGGDPKASIYYSNPMATISRKRPPAKKKKAKGA